MVEQQQMPLAFVKSGIAMGDFTSNIARHVDGGQVVIRAVPEKDRDADILQAEAPGTSEKARLPSVAARTLAESLARAGKQTSRMAGFSHNPESARGRDSASRSMRATGSS